MTTRRVDEIVVGERHRRDLGNIASLAANVAELGLLHPIVIRPDGTLVAGERRLAAARQLGSCEIPVNVMNLDAIVRGEYAENTFRKDFMLSEGVTIKHALEPLEKAARQGTRTDKHPGKWPTSSTGRAADKVAKATGVARRTVEKAEAIVEAPEAEPEKYGNRTGCANGVYRETPRPAIRSRARHLARDAAASAEGRVRKLRRRTIVSVPTLLKPMDGQA